MYSAASPTKGRNLRTMAGDLEHGKKDKAPDR